MSVFLPKTISSDIVLLESFLMILAEVSCDGFGC